MLLHKVFATTSVLALSFGMLATSAQADVIPLAVAGGGGGAGFSYDTPGGAGQAGTSGQSGFGSYGGAGGTAESGGGGGSGGGGEMNGGGGAGFLGDGGNGLGPGPVAGGSGDGGLSFAQLLTGGAGAGESGHFATGGFGGGGGGGYQGGGGGGGYSGGGGGDGDTAAGGGGGSYLAAAFTNTLLQVGVNGVYDAGGVSSSNGYVTIDKTTFGYTGSIVDYTIQTTALYDITVAGAEGGGSYSDQGGWGALISGDILLNAGTVLEIAVGGGGLTGAIQGEYGGGGGGGSFVVETSAGISSNASLPEPLTLSLIGVGLLGLGGLRRRSANA